MIPALLLYLLKAQLALLLLLGVYYGLLRRLTFHQLNRAYLLAAVGFALLYPALDLSFLRPAPAAAPIMVLPAWALRASPAPLAPAAGPGWSFWLLGMYWAGVAVVVLRLLVQLASLWRVHRASRPAVVAGSLVFRAVGGQVSPFSFGRHIYLNPAQHTPAELPIILRHEWVHVRQAHTVDVLLAHLHRAAAWWSPAAWLLLRAVQENLEFIADAAVLRAGTVPAREYQYSLARLSTLAPASSLASSFSFITLKNRIRMMNSRSSSPRQLLRYVAGLALLTPLAVACSSPQEQPTPVAAASTTQAVRNAEPLYYLDGQRIEESVLDKLDPGSFATMTVLKGEQAHAAFGAEAVGGAVIVVTKQNADSAAVKEFFRKHGITLQGSPTAAATATETSYVAEGQPITTEQLPTSVSTDQTLSVDAIKAPFRLGKGGC